MNVSFYGLLFSSAVLVAHVAHAEIKIETGEYSVGECKVSVSKLSGYYEITVTGTGGYGRFNVSAQGGKLVGGVNSCNGNEWSGVEARARFLRKTTEKTIQYAARCGGVMAPFDHAMGVTVDRESGKLVQFFVEAKTVRASLPPPSATSGRPCNGRPCRAAPERPGGNSSLPGRSRRPTALNVPPPLGASLAPLWRGGNREP